MQRTIRSFVQRAGRMSPRQQLGLDKLLSDYILPFDALWDMPAIFSRTGDTVVEIGFGMGASLLATAIAHPETNFIGIEVHRPGIGRLAADIASHHLQNIRIAPYDAVEIFKNCIPQDSLAGVQVFFPDPWPKKRHHKRRLLQSAFVHLIASKLKPGGFIHCATDWQDYAEQMLLVLSGEPTLKNTHPGNTYLPRPETRPLTKFEQRGLKLGHQVWDLKYIKTPS